MQLPINQPGELWWLNSSGAMNCAPTFEREILKPINRPRFVAPQSGTFRNRICEIVTRVKA